MPRFLLEEARSGSNIYISDNDVRCSKLNYCGIAVYGPSNYKDLSGKLGECIINNNRIHLEDGSVGIVIRKNDDTEVTNNKISGSVYYGFHLWGSVDREGFDLGSNNNSILNNDMTDLLIKAPDEYSDNHVDGRMFTGSEGKSKTAHIWLNKFSTRNKIEIEENEIKNKEIIDNPGHHPGFIPEFLHERGVDCIVAGGMGRKAESFFKRYGIETVVGVTGTIEETLERIQNGTLEGKESLCKPGLGKGYGIEKTEKQEES